MTSVIVVDDNKDIVFSMSELLEMYGIDVVGKGYNGLEGVELFNQLHPDIVLLDLMMPEYDGVYALKKIREIDPNSIIIIVTGGSPMSMNDQIESLEPTKIVFKPVDVNILVESIFEESHNLMPFKIQYVFKDDPKSYTCILTYDQYKNFKELPVLQECRIIKNDEKNVEAYKNEMQEALDLAAKNDVSHIQKLSQLV
ncbi:response regulator [Nitrosopumilus cobalaminigenes]|uniref:Response regulator n=1 Tax=Nitrosopumilus cobalaminigenes TaxID=1470066 RepID=A0A7D5M2N0_9ARCH|nr:response regulator [Nitrosopumilus cobalaminigenes]QLH03068.1 response regulator [Nitrosopumilus cobalaminigenes]